MKLINELPSKFPGYYKATEELDALYDQRDTETDEDKIHELEDKLMQKRHEIQLNYLNTIRIAGGLLAYQDLSAVSRVLKSQYEVYQKIAVAKRRIASIDLHLADSEYAKQYGKLEAEKEGLEKQILADQQILEEKTKAVEGLREEAK